MKNNSLLGYFDLIKSYPYIFVNEESPFKIITDLTEIESWQKQIRQELLEKRLPLSWSNIGIVLDDPFVLMVRDLVEFPGGKRGGYIRLINRSDLKGGQGVVVLPFLQGKILLLHQFRHATRSWHLEFPRGFGTQGMSPDENARKEVLEETGGHIGELLDLGVYHCNTGLENVTVRLYFAKLESIGSPNEKEGIVKFKWASLIEFEKLIETEKITDGFTIAAYVRAKLRGHI